MNNSIGQPFRRTREDHKNENAEDYVELINDLIEEFGEARVSALAKRLGVSEVTVSKTLRRLVKDGYVETKPYYPVKLTEMGWRVAQDAKFRHQAVVSFLIFLGVSKEIAEVDAEGIEHHVSPATLEAMRRHLDSAQTSAKDSAESK